MTQLIFLYDKLMTAREQQFVGIPFEFLSFAQVNGNLFWWNDGKQRRSCLVQEGIYKNRTSQVVYGSLWKVKEFRWQKNKLYSYYNNMSCYTGNTCPDDMMLPVYTTAVPIKFTSLSNLTKQHYERSTPIPILTFGVNLLNKDMKRWHRARYHKMPGVDKQNFLTLINERRNNNGLE